MKYLLALLLGGALCAAAMAQQVPDPLPRNSKGAVTMTDAKTAAQTSDTGTLSVFTVPGVTAMSIANAVCGGDAGCGYVTNDAIRGVMVAETGSTTTLNAAVSGYMRNKVVSGTPPDYGKNAVLLFGSGTCEIDGCKSWGVNTVLADAAGKGMPSGPNRVLVGAEFDFNVAHTGTNVIGVMATGDALVQPTLANAYAVLPLGQQAGPTPVRWTGGFVTGGGAADFAFVAGAAQRSGNDVGSQPIVWGYYDNVGAPGSVSMAVGTAAGSNIPQISFNSTALLMDMVLPGKLKLNNGVTSGIQMGGHHVLQVGVGADNLNLFIGSDSTLANVVVGGTNAILTLKGQNVDIGLNPGGILHLQNLPVVAAGTGKRFLCIDAAKVVFESSGASCN